jgi:hypothetical protein
MCAVIERGRENHAGRGLGAKRLNRYYRTIRAAQTGGLPGIQALGWSTLLPAKPKKVYKKPAFRAGG